MYDEVGWKQLTSARPLAELLYATHGSVFADMLGDPPDETAAGFAKRFRQHDFSRQCQQKKQSTYSFVRTPALKPEPSVRTVDS